MDGVGVTEVAEEGGDGRELPAPGRRTVPAGCSSGESMLGITTDNVFYQ